MKCTATPNRYKELWTLKKLYTRYVYWNHRKSILVFFLILLKTEHCAGHYYSPNRNKPNTYRKSVFEEMFCCWYRSTRQNIQERVLCNLLFDSITLVMQQGVFISLTHGQTLKACFVPSIKIRRVKSSLFRETGCPRCTKI